MKIPTKEELVSLREKYAIGTHVELTAPMNDPYTKLTVGDKATVLGVDDVGNVMCCWDNGSSLSLIPDVDSHIIIK